MTIEEAIELVRKEYENDQESAYLVNPVAHALYEVWKKADREKVWVADSGGSNKGGQGMKAMISQPMAGLSAAEISGAREKAVEYLEKSGYEVVNTLFTDKWYSEKAMEERGVVQRPLCFLAKSLENMSKCHAAFFCKGWEHARGCRIEHEAALAYGLTVIHEE